VMFIGTANYTEPVPPALVDRMEILHLPGYTQNEKLQIARRYLIPRQMRENGIKKEQLSIPDSTILAIIEKYTREAGVRNLERTIAAICRHAATKIAEGRGKRFSITPSRLGKILGAQKFESEIALRTATPGVVTGLAYTPAGGEILFVESARMPGKGMLLLTGQIGDVMKESAQAAFSVIKSGAAALKIPARDFTRSDFHLHVPAGAVPKDGPSAGVAMFTSLLSLLKNHPVRPDVAMTGEITLKGLILPVGGLKEKILAAKQAGIKAVILPKRNKKDLADIPRQARTGIKFIFVSKAQDVLKHSLI